MLPDLTMHIIPYVTNFFPKWTYVFLKTGSTYVVQLFYFESARFPHICTVTVYLNLPDLGYNILHIVTEHDSFSGIYKSIEAALFLFCNYLLFQIWQLTFNN
jgi:hypothetical protein